MNKKPKIAIFKFTGCAGCQLEILHLEEVFLELLDLFDIHFWKMVKRENHESGWDISLVEGGISTPREIEEIKQIRTKTKHLIAFGDCSIAGCIPSIRNWIPQMESEELVYSDTSVIHSLKVLGIGEYVKVDSILKGCPPHRDTIIEVLKSALLEIKPRLRKHPVCVECKFRDNSCLITSKKLACMGPVTSAGCGAICPTLDRECEGCFGPMSNPNTRALAEIFKGIGLTETDVERKFRKYAGMTMEFRGEAGH
ncbi:MAG: oxidoreductase [Candidatus Thermoplasmatota archaeon]|nr:oxidoreductase [Candidatus Thermoplasmatota archaeon]